MSVHICMYMSDMHVCPTVRLTKKTYSPAPRPAHMEFGQDITLGSPSTEQPLSQQNAMASNRDVHW